MQSHNRHIDRLVLVIGTALLLVPLVPLHALDNGLDPVVSAIVDAATRALSQKLGQPQNRDITSWFVQGDQFADTSLACPAPGKTYEKKVIAGFRIHLTAPSQADPTKNVDYQYRAASDGTLLFECTPSGPGPNMTVILPAAVLSGTPNAVATDTAVALSQAPHAPLTIRDSKLLNGLLAPVDVRWTPDGKLLGLVLSAPLAGTSPATAAATQTAQPENVQIVDLVAGTTLQSLPVPDAVGAWFSSTVRLVAVRSGDSTAQVFEVETGRLVSRLQTPTNDNADAAQTPGALTWSTDDTVIASASSGRLNAWQVNTGTLQLSQKVESGVGVALWSPDSTLLVTGYGPGAGGSPMVVDAYANKTKFTVTGVKASDVVSAKWGPNGRSIAFILQNGSTLFVSGTTGEKLRTLAVHTIEWSADIKYLAGATTQHTVRIYNTAKTSLAATLNDGSLRTNVTAFSPDGKRIATGDNDGIVRVWDVASGKLLIALDGGQSSVSEVSWKPDGTQLVSKGSDTTLRLWVVPQ